MRWLLTVLGVVLLGAALWGPIVSNVEQPKYQIADTSGNIEIRDYPPMIVAEAEVVVMPVVRVEHARSGFDPGHTDCLRYDAAGRDDRDPVKQTLERAIRAIERERHSLSGHEFMIGGHRGFSIIGDTFELPPE